MKFCPVTKPGKRRALSALVVNRCADGSIGAWAVASEDGTMKTGRNMNHFWGAVKLAQKHTHTFIVDDLSRFGAASFTKPYGYPAKLQPSLISPNGRIVAWRWRDGRDYKRIIAVSDHLARGIENIETFAGWTETPVSVPSCYDLDEYDGNDEKHENEAMERAERLLEIASRLQECYLSIGGELSPTVGGAAIRIYKRKYLPRFRNNYWTLPDHETLEKIRQAYYGGRAEVFRSGEIEGTIYNVDRNSAYAGEMIAVDLPLPNAAWALNYSDDPERVKAAWRRWPGIVRATVVVDDEPGTLPPLPHRGNGGELIFPTGTFTGSWATCELAYAESTGLCTIVEIHDAILWTKRVRYLADAARDLYNLRSRGWFEKMLGKCLITRLAGKWGQRGSKVVQLLPLERMCKPSKAQENRKIVWSYWPTKAAAIFCTATDTEEASYQAHANVIWSAIINASGRVTLHKAMSASVPFDALIYCDTDGFWSSEKPEGLDVGPKAGQWRIDEKATKFQAVARQCYRFTRKDGTTKTVVSGFGPHEARGIFEHGIASRMHRIGFAEAMAMGRAGREIMATSREIVSTMPAYCPSREMVGDGTTRAKFIGTPKRAINAMQRAHELKEEEARSFQEGVKSWVARLSRSR